MPATSKAATAKSKGVCKPKLGFAFNKAVWIDAEGRKLCKAVGAVKVGGFPAFKNRRHDDPAVWAYEF
jgi:hypothetical protein